MAVTVYVNVEDVLAGRWQVRLYGYASADRLVVVHRWTQTLHRPQTLPALCEDVWQLLNRDDRPGAANTPSLSVGDVVQLDTPDGPATYAVATVGFEQVAPLRDSQVLDGTWQQIVAEARSSG